GSLSLKISNITLRKGIQPTLTSRFRLLLSLAVSCLSILSFSSFHYPSKVQEKLVRGEYRLTPERQFELLEKILAFERSWKARTGPELRIGLLYEKSFELSTWTRDDLVAAVPAGRVVDGIPVRLIECPLEERATWEETLRQDKILFLYIAPLSPKTVKSRLREILAICRQAKVATVTGETAYLESGVAVGLGLENNAPHVFINLKAAREQGLDFSSRLLKITSIK
ncbi:MAG: YfiR family protein, partial [Candidatus Aminicenantales bacterium]